MAIGTATPIAIFVPSVGPILLAVVVGVVVVDGGGVTIMGFIDVDVGGNDSVEVTPAGNSVASSGLYFTTIAST